MSFIQRFHCSTQRGIAVNREHELNLVYIVLWPSTPLKPYTTYFLLGFY